LGGVALRAEQLGGAVGIRAAGLSLDFVDPAGLPALMAGRGAELTPLRAVVVESPAAAGAGAREMAPSFASGAAAVPAGAALSAEEWALVATFPSTTTAMQMVAARRAGQLTGATSGVTATSERAVASPERTLLSLAGPARAEGPIALRAAERALEQITRGPSESAGGERVAGAAGQISMTPVIDRGALAAGGSPLGGS